MSDDQMMKDNAEEEMDENGMPKKPAVEGAEGTEEETVTPTEDAAM